MVYQLSDAQIRDIERKLPPQLAALRKQYPVTIALLADYYHAPPFPQRHQPKLIEIYFDELADGPGIVLPDISPETNINIPELELERLLFGDRIQEVEKPLEWVQKHMELEVGLGQAV